MISAYLNNTIKNWSYPHNLFRYAILGLLLVNFTLFVSNEMLLRSIDALAWLMILVVIEWPNNERISDSMTLWPSMTKIVALGMICLSCGNSLLEKDFVSLANELTWLCVLLLPEYTYKKYKFLKLILYVSLVVYAVYWGMHQAWLDCYDAALWITAFLQLENEKYDIFGWYYIDQESSLVSDDSNYNVNIIRA